MRIVTRADFDGVVCAVLLREAEPVEGPVKWVEPNAMQKGDVVIQAGDIVANLPYHPACSLWFDHHYTNQQESSVPGGFWIAPSAARVIFDHYVERFTRDYTELVRQADKIDSADLTLEEVRHPENHPYIILSMTLSSTQPEEEPYWNRMVDLLADHPITAVMADPEVRKRCETVVANNRAYRDHLTSHTRLIDHVAVTDFRKLTPAPSGNRFLVYSLFPDANVHARIRHDPENPDKIIVNVGHSIFNRTCQVNVGLMLSRFGGGGHAGAGSCTVPAEGADGAIDEIIETLRKNVKND